MSVRKVNRRTFIKATAMTAAAALAQACAQSVSQPTSVPPTATSKPVPPTDTPKPVSKFNEAPMLADLVKAGTLPPVEQRLPPSPQVIEPVQEVGQYGGTVRTAIGNVNQLFGDPQGIIGTEGVLRIARDFNSVTTGLFDSWEFNADATEQVLHLRQGLKWSDGAPMNTEDCLFDWEDCKLNTELYPAGPGVEWRAGKDKTPMTMQAVDDYTLKLNFAGSYPLVILNQAFYAGTQYGGMWAPKHYGMQFHPKYADAATLNKLIADYKFEKWTQLFGDRMRVGSTIPAQVGLPGMTTFIRTADDPDHHTYERNPYYWKVDTAGNQLPYWDKVIIYIIADKELMTARLVSGELDFIGHSTYLKNMELYKQSLDKADLKLYMWDSVLTSAVLIWPNQTAADPELRDFFQKKNVRIALSISINRDEINDVAHFGLGTPRQASMWPKSIYFKEGDDKKYAEYDSKQANDLLDQEGYTKRDAEGYRVFPSGKRIAWSIEFDPEQGDIPPTLELFIQYWKDIGIELTIKPINRQLLNQRWAANDLTMTSWQGDTGSDVAWPTGPKEVIENAGGNGFGWARRWQAWIYQKGQFPDLEEEPPQWVKDQQADWAEFLSTVDKQARIAVARRVWDRFYEYLPCFGTVGVPQPILLKKNITNVPEWGVWGFATIRGVPANPEQFFYKQS